MKLFGGGLFNDFIGDFNLSVRPRVAKLRGSMLNAKRFAQLCERMFFLGF